jgi:hypothetical protein
LAEAASTVSGVSWRSAVLALVAGALLVATAPGANASTVISFRTPTGNIGCVYSSGFTGAEAPTVRCDIRSRLHPEPTRPGKCPLDYGDSIEISRTGRAILVCHGDTALDPRARVVAYGHAWKRGGLTCSSRSTGLRCSNQSGHGFFLSRQRWFVF